MADREERRRLLREKIASARAVRGGACGPGGAVAMAQRLRTDPTSAFLSMGIDDAALLRAAPQIVGSANVVAQSSACRSDRKKKKKKHKEPKQPSGAATEERASQTEGTSHNDADDEERPPSPPPLPNRRLPHPPEGWVMVHDEDGEEEEEAPPPLPE